MTTKVYTIGHSNHPLDVFVGLLKSNGITMLVDVRTKPHSSRQPHFGMERLNAFLKEAGISYLWGGQVLGGLNTLKVTDPLFVQKMDRIVEIADKQPTAMMCSEGKPEECHRAYKLCAWLHRARPQVETLHIMRDGSTVDGKVFEPTIPAKSMDPSLSGLA